MEDQSAASKKDKGLPTDITFKLGNFVFKANKALLAQSSDVFKAMFFGSLAHSGKIVEIQDVDPTGFRNLITFIDTGMIELKGVSDTLATAFAADMYFVPKLVDLCMENVVSKISAANIWTVYQATILLGHKRLRDVSKDFLIENAVTLLKTPQFFQCPSLILTCLASDLAVAVSPLHLLPALIAWAKRRKVSIKPFLVKLSQIGLSLEFMQTLADSNNSRVLTENETEAIMCEVRKRYPWTLQWQSHKEVMISIFSHKQSIRTVPIWLSVKDDPRSFDVSFKVLKERLFILGLFIQVYSVIPCKLKHKMTYINETTQDCSTCTLENDMSTAWNVPISLFALLEKCSNAINPIKFTTKGDLITVKIEILTEDYPVEINFCSTTSAKELRGKPFVKVVHKDPQICAVGGLILR